MPDIKIGDTIEIIDEKHAIINGVNYEMIVVIDPFLKRPVIKFIKTANENINRH